MKNKVPEEGSLLNVCVYIYTERDIDLYIQPGDALFADVLQHR